MNFIVRHLKTLGLSALDLVSAELGEVSQELKQTRRTAQRNVVQWAIVFALAFWLVGCLTFAAIAGLSLVIPPWGAALAVAALYLVGALVALQIARRQLASLESPIRTVRRRVDSHLGFWRDEVAGLTAPPTQRSRKPRDRQRGTDSSSRARQDRSREDRAPEDPTREELIAEEERRRIAWGTGTEGDDFDDLPDQQW